MQDLQSDVLHLKDGRALEGEYVSETDTSIRFKIQGTVLTFPKSRIESVEKDDPVTKTIKDADKLFADENFLEASELYLTVEKDRPDVIKTKLEAVRRNWKEKLLFPLQKLNEDEKEKYIRQQLEAWTPEKGIFVKDLFTLELRGIILIQADSAKNNLNFKVQGDYLVEGFEKFSKDEEIAILLLKFYDENKRDFIGKLVQFKPAFQNNEQVKKVVEEILLKYATEAESIGDFEKQIESLEAAIDFNNNNCEAVFQLGLAYDKNKINTDQIIDLMEPCLDRSPDRIEEITVFTEYALEQAPFKALKYIYPNGELIQDANEKIEDFLPEVLLSAFNLKPFPPDQAFNRVELYTHYLKWVPDADQTPLFLARAEMDNQDPIHYYDLGRYGLEIDNEVKAFDAFTTMFNLKNPLSELPPKIMNDTEMIDFYTTRALKTQPWKVLQDYYPDRQVHQKATSDTVRWLPEVFLACQVFKPFPEDAVFDKETLFLRYLEFRPTRSVHLENQTANLNKQQKEQYLRDRIINWRVREGYEILIVVKLELQEMLIAKADQKKRTGDMNGVLRLLREAVQILPGNNDAALKLVQFYHSQNTDLKELMQEGKIFYNCDPAVEKEILKLSSK